MNRYETVKNAMASKRNDNLFIKTKSETLIFKTEIDTEKLRVLENEYECYDGNGRIECLPIKLDDLVALRNHLSKVILALTLPKD